MLLGEFNFGAVKEADMRLEISHGSEDIGVGLRCNVLCTYR
jgi:hypothetical protein